MPGVTWLAKSTSQMSCRLLPPRVRSVTLVTVTGPFGPVSGREEGVKLEALTSRLKVTVADDRPGGACTGLLVAGGDGGADEGHLARGEGGRVDRGVEVDGDGGQARRRGHRVGRGDDAEHLQAGDGERLREGVVQVAAAAVVVAVVVHRVAGVVGDV